MEANPPARILLICPHLEELSAIGAILCAPDLIIMNALSAEEGVSLIRENEFALVILDLCPSMKTDKDGGLIPIGEFGRCSHVPILILIAAGLEKYYLSNLKPFPVADYVLKPIDPDILCRKVNIFIELFRRGKAIEKMNRDMEEINQKILEQQKHIIEEERLKVLMQMAGATAHELSQPLMMLLGSLEMIELGVGIPGRIAHHIENMKSAVARMSETIRRIHMVRRPETKPHDPTAQIINLDQNITILCVEDDAKDYRNLEDLLKEQKGIELLWVQTIKSAFETMEHTDIGLILLDHYLPDGTGIDFLMAAEQKAIEIPIVMITGHGDEGLATHVLQAGAYDYLPKNKLGKESIIRVVQNALQKAMLKNEIRLAREKMAELSTRDELTGLFNRRYFNEVLKQEMLRSDRYGVVFTLCVMVLDHFQKVNKSLGPLAGDKVLKEIGWLIESGFRQNDLKCRFGAEEFAVIFPHTNINDAVKACEAFRAVLLEKEFEFNSARFRMSVSMGVTSVEPGGVKAQEVLNRQVGDALNRAKEQGGNCLIIHAGPDLEQ